MAPHPCNAASCPQFRQNGCQEEVTKGIETVSKGVAHVGKTGPEKVKETFF